MTRTSDIGASQRPPERACSMPSTHRPKRRQRARAARQALGLCEAELAQLTPERTDGPQDAARVPRGQPRINTVTTKAALRAAGLPPPIAAALRSRLHLNPEPEAEP